MTLDRLQIFLVLLLSARGKEGGSDNRRRLNLKATGNIPTKFSVAYISPLIFTRLSSLTVIEDRCPRKYWI